MCFSFYNVNILQLNVAMWVLSAVYQWWFAYLTSMFQLEITELL